MDEIIQRVSESIKETTTIRIIADIPTELLASDNYLASASSLTSPLIQTLEKQHLVRLIAVDVYPRHTFVVIDINNHRYDFDTAHLQTFPIPVYIFHLSRKSKQWTFFRRALKDQRVAHNVANLHRHNGQNPTPFLADHIRGPYYLSPRTD